MHLCNQRHTSLSQRHAAGPPQTPAQNVTGKQRYMLVRYMPPAGLEEQTASSKRRGLGRLRGALTDLLPAATPQGLAHFWDTRCTQSERWGLPEMRAARHSLLPLGSIAT
jgi:hypothetical protein